MITDALFTDFDNDGNKDIFVANGIFKDLTDLDYIQFMADPATVRPDLLAIRPQVDHRPDKACVGTPLRAGVAYAP